MARQLRRVRPHLLVLPGSMSQPESARESLRQDCIRMKSYWRRASMQALNAAPLCSNYVQARRECPCYLLTKMRAPEDATKTLDATMKGPHSLHPITLNSSDAVDINYLQDNYAHASLANPATGRTQFTFLKYATKPHWHTPSIVHLYWCESTGRHGCISSSPYQCHTLLHH